VPKVHKLEADWDEALPLGDVLRVAEQLEALSEDDGAPVFEAQLRDGSRLTGAKSVAEFGNEIDEEAESDIQTLKAGLGPTKSALTWLEWHRAGQMTLESSGEDESKVHGVFGPTKRRIDSRLEAIARGEVAPPSSPIAGQTQTGSGVQVGAINAHTVSLSGSGPASATSSASSAPKKESSWKLTWVTVAAPLLVGVVGGLILYLVTSH
jgi:hypothetical protein